jgi:UDP-glucose 4-epimerase
LNKPRILVTGGCGYIGSHTIVELIASGYEVISVDNGVNSSFGVLNGVEAITGVRVHNINVDLSQTDIALSAIREFGSFDGIVHFAALKRVEESVRQPVRYYRNNVGSTMTTMVLMEELRIPHLIFSSSCTVYGSPAQLPVTESTPFGKAENPYGATKQACEILYDQFFRQTKAHSGISLRYFNPAGAHASALIGEDSSQEATNLVPIITETAMGLRDQMVVHGTDYPTRDGSCIRDYIHVTDLARAHTLAMDYLLHHHNTSSYEIFNLGLGQGVTVLEAISAFERATGLSIRYRKGPRRPGDVPAIYAENTNIVTKLKWEPVYDMHSIMQTAWAWEKTRRK